MPSPMDGLDELFIQQSMFNADGSWTMPAWAVERWQRQAKTPYSELSEQEKDNDRTEADRFLFVIMPFLKQP